MNRKRVLFVDDDADVLGALRRLLHKQRERWEIVVACSGDDALAELARSPVDVVVTDMQMPGMDGAALLARVKAEYPGTARLILSGHASRDAVLRSLAVAHQFLSKPCDVADLRAAIERTGDLHRLLTDEGLRRAVGDVARLPSVPRTYVELTAAANNPDIGLADVANIVVSDPAMSIKVLQLVNSAYFGCARQVASIRQAVSYLGLELLRGLALTSRVFASMEARPIEGFSMSQEQTRAVAGARLAKKFLADPQRAEEAFTAALVHDIGKVILAIGRPTQFAAVVREVRESGRGFHVVEQELLGVTHAEVGAYLLGVWGLPFSIVEAVAYHHRPGDVAEGPRDVLAAVHAADALLEEGGPAAAAAPSESRIDLAFLQDAGLTGQLARWRALASEELRDVHRAA